MSRLFKQWYVLTSTRFPPLKYLLYSSLFAAAVEKSSQTTPDDSLLWNGFAVFGCFLLMWFMRIVDEIKDLNVDRKFNPQRPLVTGVVSLKSALLLVLFLSVAITAMSFVQGPLTGLIAIGIMAYSLILVGAERIWPWFEKSMFVNVLFAVQLKTMLVYFVWSHLPRDSDHIVMLPIGFLAAAIVSCYLHWEILRKTDLKHTEKGSYSNEIGTAASLATGLLLLSLAITFAIYFSPTLWLCAVLFCGAALPSLIATILFVRGKIKTKLVSALALISYLIFLSILSCFALIQRAVNNSWL